MTLVVCPPPFKPKGSLQWMQPPVMGVCYTPMIGMRPSDMHVVPVGVALRSFVIEANGPVVCHYNGEWLLRDHWDELTKPGDIICWFVMPQSRETLRGLLQIALLVSLFIPGVNIAAGITLTGALSAANLAFNLLVPPRQQTPDQGAPPGSVFSTSLGGNAARLDQPIWVNYGHVKITPPFAAQPYFEFLASDPANPTVDCDQYYYVLFAVGVGNHELVKAFIGKTPVSHFADVLVAQYLAPGIQPSTVLANVVTSAEVGGLELNEALYVGGYAACRPLDTVTEIGIDIVAPQGIGRLDGGGSLVSVTVQWQVEIREINDFGAPIAEWQIIANESRTAETNTPQRWSNTYTLSAPIRCEVRVVRTNAKNTDSTARDEIQWLALRAYLTAPAPLNPDTAHYEVVMRASQQLSGESTRDFSMIVNRLLPTWDPIGGWAAESFTRNPAWALADVWRNDVSGEGLPDDRIDLQGLYEWSLTLDARQDRFDYSFTTTVEAWDAAQTIARTGRARASRPVGIYTIARDEYVDLPTSAFTVRNTQPKSMALSAVLPDRTQPDAVWLQYQSGVKWDTDFILCPCPGLDASDVVNAVFIPLDGVIGAKHAEREGLYMAAKIALRGTSVKCATEMEGMLVRFLDTVRWQPEFTGYGQSGDVVDFDVVTLVMTLTEPPDFSAGTLYLTLIRDDGSLTDPVVVIPGPTAFDVTLPASPDFTLILNDGFRERPKYLIGTASGDEVVKVESISDGGKTDDGAQLFEITAVVDDPRVHEADNHLLPGPGDLQDPIDDGSDVDEGGGGTAVLVRLNDHTVFSTDTAGNAGGVAGFALYGDGTAGYLRGNVAEIGSPLTGLYPNEWLNTAPVEPAVAALYECYANDSGLAQLLIDTSSTVVPSGVFNAWIALDADRIWKIEQSTGGGTSGSFTFSILLSIRRIGSTVVQATRTINLVIYYGPDLP